MMSLPIKHIEIADITMHQLQIARQVYQDFGEGRNIAMHYFGGGFAYALARETHEPLLFKGKEFIHSGHWR